MATDRFHFIEGFQAGYNLVNSIRQQKLEKQRLDQEKQIADMQERRKALEAEAEAATNRLNRAVDILRDPSAPRHTKVGLYNRVVKPFFQDFVGQDTPELPDWPDFGNDFFGKVAGVRDMKNITNGDKLAMYGDLYLEHSGDFKGWLESQTEALAPEKTPTAEQQLIGQLTPEQLKEAAIKKFGLDPKANLEIQTVPFGDQRATVVIDKDSFDPKTGAINARILTMGDGKQAVGKEEKSPLINLEKGLPAETGGKLALVVNAVGRYDKDIIPQLFPNGKLDKQALLEAKTGSTARGRVIASALSTMRAAILRPETGASAPTQEQLDIAKRIEPSILFDDSESAKTNLEAAVGQMAGFMAITDPTKKYREAIKAEQDERSKKIVETTKKNPTALIDELIELLSGETR